MNAIFDFKTVPIMRDILRVHEIRGSRGKYAQALRGAYNWIGPELDSTRGYPRDFAKLYDAIDTAALHIDPFTFARSRKLCIEAITKSGLIPGLFPRGAGAAMRTHDWKIFWSATTSSSQRNTLYRAVTWCCWQGIEPSGVRQSTIDSFLKFQRETSADKRLEYLPRQLMRVWNEVADCCPTLTLRKLTVPKPKTLKRVPLSKVPKSLLVEWEGAVSYYSVADRYAENRRKRALRPSSLTAMWGRIHQAIDAAVRSGVAIESLQKIEDLLDERTFAVITDRLVTDNKANDKAVRAVLNDLMSVGREWLQIGDARLVRLQEIIGLTPKPTRGMGRNIHRAVRRFSDEVVTARLLECSDDLFADAEEQVTVSRKTIRALQAAIGINMLIYTGVRIGDLRSLRYGSNIKIFDDGEHRLFISATNKSKQRPLQIPLPRRLVAQVATYRTILAPQWMGYVPDWIWDNGRNSPKSSWTIRETIKTHILHYVGVEMTPQTFRPLLATWMLDHAPGNYDGVKDLLGHDDLAVTKPHYIGNNPARGLALHSGIISRQKARRKLTVNQEQHHEARHFLAGILAQS